MSTVRKEIYEAIGPTLEHAMRKAHLSIPPRPHRDFAISRTVDWGMQRGGITDEVIFWVSIVEDTDSPFKT